MSKITSRMRWITKQMREHDALIVEHRDTYMEESSYQLENDEQIFSEITEPMVDKLFDAGLIVEVDTIDQYDKNNVYQTTTSVYGLKENQAEAK